MKTLALAVALSALVGCAASAPTAAPSLTGAAVAGPGANAAKAEAPAAAATPAASAEKVAEEETETLPKIELTPPAELRKNTKAKLEAALKSVKRMTTASQVTGALTAALGKPTWIEDGARKVWVATDNFGCTRIVLEEDGTSNFESLRSTETKTLSSKSRLVLCTGQIEAVEPL